ncbi:HAMP domain-containing protein [Salibacterium salarium]|uniref:HAMP domain-containing protein n=1 Tax=Salibacterium salarium TaxID=284579 RepID=A0A3R9QNN8_9BACI|nr:methyl-accepting chemotaxis protein [Salibacterium salarium]RSL29982.1 HAMP domain-containing protein [Salibacterium salarium]
MVNKKHFSFNKSIKNKLTGYLLLIGLIPTIILGFFIYQSSTDEIIAKEKQGLESVVESTSEGMDQWFEKRLSHIKLMAQTEAMMSEEGDRQLRLANVIKNSDDTYENVVFTDADGIVRADTSEENIGNLDLNDRAYFQNGMNGEDTISSVLVSKDTDSRVVVVATPVYDDNQEVIGVLSAVINFEALIGQFLETEEMDADGIMPILVDDSNTIQVHENEELIGQTVTDTNLNSVWQNQIEEGKQGVGSSTLEQNNEEMVMAHAPLSMAEYGIYLVVPMSTVLSATDAIQTQAFVMLAIAAVVIIVMARVIANTISRPVQTITDEVQKVAEGDLTGEAIQVKGKDEIGQLATHFNHMTGYLKDLLHQVRSSSEMVSASSEELQASAEQSSRSSEEITQSIQQVASGSESQTQGINESAESMDEVSKGVQEMAETSSSISENAAVTIQKSKEGGESVQQTLEKMQSIHESVEVSSQVNTSLNNRSQEIEKILQVITSIAEQTNLLALNAAIEAARAGESGKGFAVVADEVRKLAEESQSSSQQITNIIKEIQNDITESIQSISTVSSEVNEGLTMASGSQESFEEISKYTGLVAEQIESLAATSQQIAASSQQVSASFNEITQVSRDNSARTQSVAASSEEQAASSEEIDSSAKSLSSLAEELQKAVNKFKF